jgi:hypothetical protein
MSNRQQSSVLPHLPKGIAMPNIQVPNQNELMMPGQKSLPPANWKNSDENSQNQRQLVPSSDPGTSRSLSVARQGVPWTDRQSKLQIDSSSEPPPLFTAVPKKMAIRHPRETKSSKQIYRMDNGIDPVILLTSRLESWRLAIKSLVSLCHTKCINALMINSPPPMTIFRFACLKKLLLLNLKLQKV